MGLEMRPRHLCHPLNPRMETDLSQPAQSVTSESIRALNDRIQQASAFVDLIDHEMEKARQNKDFGMS